MAAGHPMRSTCSRWFSFDGYQRGYRPDNSLLSLPHGLAEPQLPQGECNDEVPHSVRHSTCNNRHLLHEHGEPPDC